MYQAMHLLQNSTESTTRSFILVDAQDYSYHLDTILMKDTDKDGYFINPESVIPVLLYLTEVLSSPTSSFKKMNQANKSNQSSQHNKDILLVVRTLMTTGFYDLTFKREVVEYNNCSTGFTL